MIIIQDQKMVDSDGDNSSLSSGASGDKLNEFTPDDSQSPLFIPDDFPIHHGEITFQPQFSSRISEISMGLDAAGLSDPDSDDEEELIPKKGMHSQGGLLAMLPLEEELSLSDDDEEDSDEDSDSGDGDGNQKEPQVEYEKFQGKDIMRVTDQIANDHYGDSGLYSGSVTVEALVPHGKGLLLYENSRIYDGAWEDGKWYELNPCFPNE